MRCVTLYIAIVHWRVQYFCVNIDKHIRLKILRKKYLKGSELYFDIKFRNPQFKLKYFLFLFEIRLQQE